MKVTKTQDLCHKSCNGFLYLFLFFNNFRALLISSQSIYHGPENKEKKRGNLHLIGVTN